MANDNEEKESKGSSRIMLTMSDKLKTELESRADELGVPLTQYIMTLVVNDLRKPLKS